MFITALDNAYPYETSGTLSISCSLFAETHAAATTNNLVLVFFVKMVTFNRPLVTCLIEGPRHDIDWFPGNFRKALAFEALGMGKGRLYYI